MAGLLLVQDVEDRSLHGIEGDEFQRMPVVDLPGVDVVVEVESARLLGRDLRILEARLGENQRLRTDRNAKYPKYGAQVAVPGLVLQFDVAAIQPLLELRDGVVEVFGPIVNGRIAERHIPLILDDYLAAGGDRKAQHTESDDNRGFHFRRSR